MLKGKVVSGQLWCPGDNDTQETLPLWETVNSGDGGDQATVALHRRGARVMVMLWRRWHPGDCGVLGESGPRGQ